MFGICNGWVSMYVVGFVMCGCVYVWVCIYVGLQCVGVCTFGLSNVTVCVGLGF